MTFSLLRRCLIAAAAVGATLAAPAFAQTKLPLRISTPAVPDDWHGKMWTVFKESLDKSAPGEFDVQINLNASLFKQGTEPAAMARGNLELSSISAFDIAKLVPEFSIFTAGYVIRDPAHQAKVFAGPIGQEMFKLASEKMEVTILTPIYLGTRQINLREARNVKTPADLKGVKLRMPGSKEWLFLGEALGATATPLAFGEVYLGLKTGTIDGQDNPLPSVRAAKFYEVTKQIVMTNHLVDGIFIAISDKAWKAMTRSATPEGAGRGRRRSGVQQQEPPRGRSADRRFLQEGRADGDDARCRGLPQIGAGGVRDERHRQGLARRPARPHQQHEMKTPFALSRGLSLSKAPCRRVRTGLRQAQPERVCA